MKNTLIIFALFLTSILHLSLYAQDNIYVVGNESGGGIAFGYYNLETCITVTATFTGMPPFNLTYTTPIGTVTQVFTGNTGAFQVCAPAGTAAGALGVQATNLTDAWCTCQ